MTALAGHMGMLALGSSGGGGTGPLLHFDGTNGSTSIVDAHGVSTWAVSASAQLSTAQAKFGATSLFVNGGRASTSDMGVGLLSANFCIEGWAYYTTGTPRGIFHTALPSGATGLALGWNNATSQWQIYTGGGSWNSTTTSIPSGWFHWAVYRVGSTVVATINGVAVITTTYTGDFNSFVALNIGVYYNASFPWAGYIDEVRVTNGSSPYPTTGFTPPSAPFT